MIFTKPKAGDTFTITAAPEWPSIVFETDAAGPHTWNWTIGWRSFKKSGTQMTPGNTWDAKSVITNLGGSLTVMASAASPCSPKSASMPSPICPKAIGLIPPIG